MLNLASCDILSFICNTLVLIQAAKVSPNKKSDVFTRQEQNRGRLKALATLAIVNIQVFNQALKTSCSWLSVFIQSQSQTILWSDARCHASAAFSSERQHSLLTRSPEAVRQLQNTTRPAESDRKHRSRLNEIYIFWLHLRSNYKALHFGFL